jgi:DNA recombination protein RmuC
LQTVTHSLDSAEVRSRAIVRKLKDVEALPETQARELLTREGDTQETP